MEFSWNRNNGKPFGICFFDINVETYIEKREGEKERRVFTMYRNNGTRTLVVSRKRVFIEGDEE